MNGILVFLGGGLGALIRYCICLIMPQNCYLPYYTLIANFCSCFLATVILMYLVIKSDLNAAYKLFFIVGFCGGLSTVSSLSLELLSYFQNGAYLKAILYFFISVLVCVSSVILGLIVIKKIV